MNVLQLNFHLDTNSYVRVMCCTKIVTQLMTKAIVTQSTRFGGDRHSVAIVIGAQVGNTTGAEVTHQQCCRVCSVPQGCHCSLHTFERREHVAAVLYIINRSLLNAVNCNGYWNTTLTVTWQNYQLTLYSTIIPLP